MASKNVNGNGNPPRFNGDFNAWRKAVGQPKPIHIKIGEEDFYLPRHLDAVVFFDFNERARIITETLMEKQEIIDRARADNRDLTPEEVKQISVIKVDEDFTWNFLEAHVPPRDFGRFKQSVRDNSISREELGMLVDFIMEEIAGRPLPIASDSPQQPSKAGEPLKEPSSSKE